MQSAAFNYPGQATGGMQVFYNPPVPFLTRIVGGMFPGRMIYISGILPPNAERFDVNLMCGSSDKSDIALHMDVRLHVKVTGERKIFLRNAFQNGAWGTEETDVTHFPFKANTHVDMLILAEHGQFKIAVNNEHLVEFKHRIKPLHNIDTLRINKFDLQLTQVRIQ